MCRTTILVVTIKRESLQNNFDIQAHIILAFKSMQFKYLHPPLKNKKALLTEDFINMLMPTK